ncbi:Trm112 family protein [Gracilimonas mengyeensis]|uniref:Uncharacterized conserved protein YbaR, Trm112 family n=1 Tax=Gracilimonas mengyeensis TaxID=1302730 RepID=A0A521CVT0_9BACT|nr:Trm112 family protein [Gracilimonas mengyeensis]SMO63557.1 Uncharacterized conserved protein YbaR, Trm112 family [Gracilimonas mengyeensis]
MKASLIDKLCCPMDKHDLNMRVFVKHEDGDIIEALLTCPECRRYFPVISGVPIMTLDEYRDKSIEAPTLQRWGVTPAALEGENNFELKEEELLAASGPKALDAPELPGDEG